MENTKKKTGNTKNTINLDIDQSIGIKNIPINISKDMIGTTKKNIENTKLWRIKC
jgi:hypothetical protein